MISFGGGGFVEGDRRLLSAADMVADEIRDMIYRGMISPGGRIDPEALAVRLGVSKTPVRDALQALKVEGLVKIQPRVGAFVRDVSEREAADVYLLKETIEPLAASLAAERATPKCRALLRKLLRRLRSAVSRGDVAGAELAVNDIHIGIFNMSSSDVLQDTFRVFNGRVRQLRFLNMSQPGRLELTLEHHEVLVGAVVESDSKRAEELMRSHLVDASAALQRALLARRDSSVEAAIRDGDREIV